MLGNYLFGAKAVLVIAIGALLYIIYLNINSTTFLNLQLYQRPTVSSFNTVDLTSLTEQEKSLKKILVWNCAYGDKHMGFGYGQEPFLRANCPESRCLLTANRILLPVDKFDAIIMQFRGIDYSDLPKNRTVNQRWIFYEMESASYIMQDPGKFNNLFNWTMTYKRNSDIWSSYATVVPIDNTVPEIFAKENALKTKLAAWFVSNCKSMSWREKIVKDLQKYIQIDIYGECGPLKCSRKNETLCYKMLEKTYKFYLSFENSLCKDYVTEKLYSVLKYNVVPIVYGLSNYSVLAPHHSYINYFDFANAQKLANYLLYLNQNDTAYNEYFEWKSKYKILQGLEHRSIKWCNLCKKLHTDTKINIYKNLTDWFVTKSNCKRLLPIKAVKK